MVWEVFTGSHFASGQEDSCLPACTRCAFARQSRIRLEISRKFAHAGRTEILRAQPYAVRVARRLSVNHAQVVIVPLSKAMNDFLADLAKKERSSVPRAAKTSRAAILRGLAGGIDGSARNAGNSNGCDVSISSVRANLAPSSPAAERGDP